jgi:hypothetical protein
VPKRIANQDARIGYDDFLSQLADKFAAAAHTDREAATWAVGAWAFALGKPAGYRPVATAENAGRVYEEPPPPRQEHMVQVLMATIVTLGGFLGGGLGGLMLPLVVMAADVAADYHTKGGPMSRTVTNTAVTSIAVLVAVAAVGASSGVGALAGWLLGRGSERPWASFGTAFATALGTNMVVLFCMGPLLGAPIQFGFVFAATYRSAARGGGD